MRMLSTSSSNPFYLFGYGSLLWRPSDNLKSFPSFSCTSYGYKRLFVQRSEDHRGIEGFPGLVCTLVHDNDLISEKLRHLNLIKDAASVGLSECNGLVWLIPDNERESLLAELDYREKGGYTRHSINIRLRQSTPYHEVGSIAEAVVYTGSIDNPLFDFNPLSLGSLYYHKHMQSSSYYTSTVTTSRTTTTARHKYSNSIRPINRGANIISASKGPSGTNIDYLFGLLYYLENKMLEDEYLGALGHDVLLRVGYWRAYFILYDIYTRNISTYTPKSIYSNNSEHSESINRYHSDLSLYPNKPQYVTTGWGSNEYHQLSHSISDDIVPFPVTLHTPSSSPSTPMHNTDHGYSNCSTELDSNNSGSISNNSNTSSNSVYINLLDSQSHIIKYTNKQCVISSIPSQSQSQPQPPSDLSYTIPLYTYSTKTTTTNTDNTASISTITTTTNSSATAFATTNASTNNTTAAYTTDTISKLISDREEYISRHLPCTQQLYAGGRWSGRLIGHTLTLWGDGIHELIDIHSYTTTTDSTNSDNITTLVFEDVVGCAIGSDHMLILSTAGQIIGLGNNVFGQCLSPIIPFSGTSPFISGISPEIGTKVVKIGVGLKFSACITDDGVIHYWGQRLYNNTTATPTTTITTDTSGTAHTGSKSTHSDTLYKDYAYNSWQPPNHPSAKVIDFACGAKHVTCIDDTGQIWTFGSNKFGSLGRKFTTDFGLRAVASAQSLVVGSDGPGLVELLKIDHIRWQRVSCIIY